MKSVWKMINEAAAPIESEKQLDFIIQDLGEFREDLGKHKAAKTLKQAEKLLDKAMDMI
jgi:hypothetical protein